MREETLKFNDTFKNNIDFQIKVIIWHILTTKVFLDEYFEKYYVNFIKDGEFDSKAFMKSIGYIDLMFNGDNYTDRYSLFEKNEDLITQLLLSEHHISQTLKESIIWDIIHIIGKTDELGVLELYPYDLDIIEDEASLKIVRKGMNDFIKNQIWELNTILTGIEINQVRSSFIKKIKEILKKTKA